MHWFKRHPEFLRKESTALSNDSNYKEFYQCRDNLFISHGEIIVRLNKVNRFPIIIIYTEATPYKLPSIFPLQNVIEKETIEEISRLSYIESLTKIKPFIKFYYELRHQNSTGELCILESENLDKGSNFFGITTLLKRVRDWFAGQITGEFPPDSEEVDFCSHFNFINNEIKLIYPEFFLNDTLVEGDCYAALENVINKSVFCTNTQYLYFGIHIDGIGKSGLIEKMDVNLSTRQLHEKLKTSLDLYNHPTIINELIEQRILLKAHWFHIKKEPKPFKFFKDLVLIIGNGNYEFGVKRITSCCYNTLKGRPENFIVGIRFPNRKGIFEFQLFKILIKKTPPLIVVKKEPYDLISNILESYESIEAIEGEKFTEASYHQRNSLRADRQILQKNCINLLGVGAIGSELADCLSKAGIGRISLFDSQTLKAHNSIRHIAGLEYIGQNKVTSVADIIHRHNPFVLIRTVVLNLYNVNVVEHFEDDSICISSLADDNLEGFLNEQLVISNKTAFYIRSLRGGKIGRIFRVIPGKDACFYCLSLYRKQEKEFIDIPEDPDYPTLKNECNNPIRPASAADLKLIASFASSLIIDFFQNSNSLFNHWIWSSEKINSTPIQYPNKVYTQTLLPHKDCPYCNNERQIKVSILENTFIFMQKLIQKNSSFETGGVLAGQINGNNDITITHASDPGPGAIQSATKFEKDVKYCQEFLDKLYIESNRKIFYLGEWHSHPNTNNNPSGTDLNSLSEIAFEKEYLTDCPVMIIFSNEGVPSCTIHPAGKRFYFSSLDII